MHGPMNVKFTDYISPSSAEVKNDWSYTFIPPHTFMTYTGQLYLTFELHFSRGQTLKSRSRTGCILFEKK